MHPGDGENAGQRAEVDDLLDPETARAAHVSVRRRNEVPTFLNAAATVAWVGYADPLARGLPSRPPKAKTESRQRRPLLPTMLVHRRTPISSVSPPAGRQRTVRGRR